jgi:hypothetical protein
VPVHTTTQNGFFFPLERTGINHQTIKDVLLYFHTLVESRQYQKGHFGGKSYIADYRFSQQLLYESVFVL